MSKKSDLVLLPGLELPWRDKLGYWQLTRNGVAISLHPFSCSFAVKLAPDWREAKRSSKYVGMQHAVDGLFDYLLQSWLLDVVMADTTQGAQDGREDA